MSLSPENVQVHPDWNPNVESYDANIAIIKFEDGAITFSLYVQPICLWNMTPDPTETVIQVDGWGQLGANYMKIHTDRIPMKYKLSTQTNEFCISKSEDLADLASDRTFCGIRSRGCTNNKSGGLSTRVRSTFYFRGIVSSGFHNVTSCDSSKYAIFTDGLKFKPWIDQTMSKDDEIFYLRCTFLSLSDSGLFYESEDLKVCNIYDQKIDGEGFSVAGDPNPSIQIFYIKGNKEVKFLPENIAKSFPRFLRSYHVINCSISTVNGKHFKGLNNLRHLTLKQNKIEAIDGDSFKDLTQLNVLDLSANKITTIDPNLFQSLEYLTQLVINENPILFLDENVFVNLRLLNEISLKANLLLGLHRNLFKNNLILQRINLSDNQLLHINSTMFDHLKYLYIVDLRFNICVNDFYDQKPFKEMKIVLRKNCAFDKITSVLLRIVGNGTGIAERIG